MTIKDAPDDTKPERYVCENIRINTEQLLAISKIVETLTPKD